MTRDHPLGEIPLGFQWEHTFSNHQDRINALAWTSDGQLLVSAGDDGTVRYSNPMSGKEIRQHSASGGKIRNFLLLPAQYQIAICPHQENLIAIQDMETGSRIINLYGHRDPVRALILTPDQNRIVSASGDHTLRIWGLTSGISHSTLHGHTGAVNTVVISPDGQLIFSGGEDGVIRCWDAGTARERDPIGSHNGAVTALALSQDGTMLVSGSEDREICFWEVSSGHLFRILERHTDTILSLVFSPDGRI
ncbi:MAG TPA: WD40 repeat domain-containing protein, partial [Aggregatilineales bacterium]|nr:WD40 repeat domain-containing protein [Aggregatilineales bacterium]